MATSAPTVLTRNRVAMEDPNSARARDAVRMPMIGEDGPTLQSMAVPAGSGSTPIASAVGSVAMSREVHGKSTPSQSSHSKELTSSQAAAPKRSSHRVGALTPPPIPESYSISKRNAVAVDSSAGVRQLLDQLSDILQSLSIGHALMEETRDPLLCLECYRGCSTAPADSSGNDETLLKFDILLWQGRRKTAHQVIVELQRRRGCAIATQCIKRAVFQAITGMDNHLVSRDAATPTKDQMATATNSAPRLYQDERNIGPAEGRNGKVLHEQTYCLIPMSICKRMASSTHGGAVQPMKPTDAVPHHM